LNILLFDLVLTKNIGSRKLSTLVKNIVSDISNIIYLVLMSLQMIITVDRDVFTFTIARIITETVYFCLQLASIMERGSNLNHKPYTCTCDTCFIDLMHFKKVQKLLAD
jgi:hypothetical protein